VSAPHLGPGTVVAGKYTIRTLLAFHGATATYHASDSQGGQVALKLLEPAIGQRADVMGEIDRVKAESAALSTVGILPILDSGYDPATSAPFVASEYLTIPSLARLLENGPLSEQVVQLLLRGVARTLDAAHARSLVHHSLKPTNLFVGPAPNYPVLTADFSARVIRDAVPTQEAYASSAPWLAPEQLQGPVQPSPQPDVYAAALIAFYALTGRPYWLSCQSSPADLHALQQEALAPHVPVSGRAQELGRPLNPALDGAFARALAANPAERPVGVGQLVQTMWPGDASAVAAPMPQASHPGYAAAPPPSSPAMAVAAPSAPQMAPVQAGPNGAVADPQVVPGGGSQHGSAVAASAAPHPGTPGLPAFPEPAKARKSRSMLPVIIGVIGAVLLGGAAVAYLFLRTPTSADGGESVPTAAATAEPATSATADDSSASSSPAEDTDAGGGAGEADGGGTVEVSFVCVPECDKLVVDGEKVDKPADPVQLLPGKHTVEATKRGYVPRKESLVVELGEPVEKKLVLVRITGAPPKKNCGKFLKRCD